MSTKTTVPVEGVSFLIDQAYNAGRKYQWARETLVNSLQAHATWVEFGIEQQLVEGQGVAKRYVADNGKGMNEDELKTYMTSFGGGGKPIGHNENFGQGQKSSCYPWNTYGIIVVSWTKETPEGLMIWIHKDADGDFAMRDFEVEYPDGTQGFDDIIIPGYDEELGIDISVLKTPQIEAAGQGTVFLFLGDSLERDTANGDFLRGEDSIYGITQYLNTRFVSLPEGVTIRIVNLEGKLPSQSEHPILTFPDGTRKAMVGRRITGIQHYLTWRQLSVNGSVTVDTHGTTVEWTLTKEEHESRFGPQTSLIVVEYESTFEGVPITEAYNITASIRDYRNFGISSSKVAKRLWLRICPPILHEGSTGWGVMPQASRGMLISKGSLELPWEEWGNNFFEQLPKDINDAINEERAENISTANVKDFDRLKDLLSRLNMRMRPIRIVEIKKGTESGVPSGQFTGKTRVVPPVIDDDTVKPPPPPPPPVKKPRIPSGGTGKVNILNENQAGSHKGVSTRRGDGIPGVKWIDKWEDDATAAATWVEKDTVRLSDGSASSGVIHINAKYPLFTGERDYWLSQYVKANPDDVIDLMREVYGQELVTKVMHAKKLEGGKYPIPQPDSKGNVQYRNFSRSDVDKLLTNEALTTGVLGLMNVEARILKVAAQRFGKHEAAA